MKYVPGYGTLPDSMTVEELQRLRKAADSAQRAAVVMRMQTQEKAQLAEEGGDKQAARIWRNAAEGWQAHADRHKAAVQAFDAELAKHGGSANQEAQASS